MHDVPIATLRKLVHVLNIYNTGSLWDIIIPSFFYIHQLKVKRRIETSCSAYCPFLLSLYEIHNLTSILIKGFQWFHTPSYWNDHIHYHYKDSFNYLWAFQIHFRLNNIWTQNVRTWLGWFVERSKIKQKRIVVGNSNRRNNLQLCKPRVVLIAVNQTKSPRQQSSANAYSFSDSLTVLYYLWSVQNVTTWIFAKAFQSYVT